MDNASVSVSMARVVIKLYENRTWKKVRRQAFLSAAQNYFPTDVSRRSVAEYLPQFDLYLFD